VAAAAVVMISVNQSESSSFFSCPDSTSFLKRSPPWDFSGFPADATKERHEKAIPINHHAKAVLDDQMRHLHHDY
jgi:hypothetical protein